MINIHTDKTLTSQLQPDHTTCTTVDPSVSPKPWYTGEGETSSSQWMPQDNGKVIVHGFTDSHAEICCMHAHAVL